MASEQFSLCWDNFHKNMSNGMNDLLECEDLVDVTLAIEGKYLKAHKMVLSVCSPYFKELFKTNPCQHPIVFMKDVTYEAMSDLLQFMYQGEVQVSQENLSTFIKTAEALQIKGLTGDGNGSNETETETTSSMEKPRKVETYKPIIKPKKQPATPMSSTPVPQAKRTRLSVSSNESRERAVSKVEISSNLSDFKMEPYEQQQQEQQMMVEDVGEETFDDTTLDETGADEIGGDDGDDYSMIESAGREEEPKASTSGDGVAEGQEDWIHYVPGPRHQLIVHRDFLFSLIRPSDQKHNRYKRYGCSKRKSEQCKALITVDSRLNKIYVSDEHCHAPDSKSIPKGTSRKFVAEKCSVHKMMMLSNQKFAFIKNEGKTSDLIVNKQVYRKAKKQANGTVWICVKKNCKAICGTKDGRIVFREGLHDHEPLIDIISNARRLNKIYKSDIDD